MKPPKNQHIDTLEADFEMLWCVKVQALTALRKSKMSQSTIAAMTGRSLKTIQRFENYRSKDAELAYLYKRCLND